MSVMYATLYDTNFVAVAVIEEFKSFIWTDRYYGCGDFELVLPATTENIRTFKDDYFMTLAGSDFVMIIEGRELKVDTDSGDTLTITGRSVESILDRRIVWKQTRIQRSKVLNDKNKLAWPIDVPTRRRYPWYEYPNELENGLMKLVNDAIIDPTADLAYTKLKAKGKKVTAAQTAEFNDYIKRKIPGFTFRSHEEIVDGITVRCDPYIKGLLYTGQYTGDNLYDVFVDVCKANKIGFKIDMEPNENALGWHYILYLYHGTDRTYNQIQNLRNWRNIIQPAKKEIIKGREKWVEPDQYTDEDIEETIQKVLNHDPNVTTEEKFWAVMHPYVVFSRNYDNLISSDYSETKNIFKNVSLVAGEGEGSARKTLMVSTAGLNMHNENLRVNGVYSSIPGIVSNTETTGLFTFTFNTPLSSPSIIGRDATVRQEYLATLYLKVDNISYPIQAAIEITPGSVYNITLADDPYEETEGEGFDDLPGEIGRWEDEALLRRELFIDARDIQSKYKEVNPNTGVEVEKTYTKNQYTAALQQRGEEKLGELQYDRDFEADIEATQTFLYGKDFFLGDLLEIESDYGVQSLCRVTEYIHYEDASGYKEYPTFEIEDDPVNTAIGILINDDASDPSDLEDDTEDDPS